VKHCSCSSGISQPH